MEIPKFAEALPPVGTPEELIRTIFHESFSLDELAKKIPNALMAGRVQMTIVGSFLKSINNELMKMARVDMTLPENKTRERQLLSARDVILVLSAGFDAGRKVSEKADQ